MMCASEDAIVIDLAPRLVSAVTDSVDTLASVVIAAKIPELPKTRRVVALTRLGLGDHQHVAFFGTSGVVTQIGNERVFTILRDAKKNELPKLAKALWSSGSMA